MDRIESSDIGRKIERTISSAVATELVGGFEYTWGFPAAAATTTRRIILVMGHREREREKKRGYIDRFIDCFDSLALK